MIAPEFRQCKPTNLMNDSKKFLEQNHGTDLYVSVAPSLQEVDEIKTQLVNAPKFRCDPEQLEKFADLFAKNYQNAMKIADELKIKPPQVKSWELMDSAFSFSRVRRYDEVQQNMDMLEHFQDNLNTNISNLQNVDNFIRVGKTVQSNFNNKYHDGEFADPAKTDPREVEEGDKYMLV